MKRVWGILAASVLAFGTAQNLAVGSFFFADEEDTFENVRVTYIFTRAFDDGDAVLIWRCRGDELRLMVGASTYLATDGTVWIRSKFDENEPSGRQQWVLIPGSDRVIVAPNQDDNAFWIALGIDPQEQLTARAKRAEQVMFRIEDYRQRTYTYTFNLDGLVEALSLLHCGSE